MDKVQQIRAEIERLDVENARKGIYKEISRDCECGFANALTLLRNFIHSLPEESVSDDLEQEIQRHLKDCLDVKFPTTDIESIKKDVEFTARHFAKWQEEKDKRILQEEGLMIMPDEQFETMKRSLIKLSEEKENMMKEALEGIVHRFCSDEIAAIHYNDPSGVPMSCYMSSKGLKPGDKVKIVIFKEAQNGTD